MNKVFLRLRKSQSGFTLIELLVVVAIIGLLAAFAMPRLFEAINKAREAPGNADLKTISGALERYYLEDATNQGRYPFGTPDQVKTALKGKYLKSDTSFINGFKQGYIYMTNATGSGYLLVDPGKVTAAFSIDCNGAAVGEYNVDPTADFQAVTTVTDADLTNVQNCVADVAGVRIMTH